MDAILDLDRSARKLTILLLIFIQFRTVSREHFNLGIKMIQ